MGNKENSGKLDPYTKKQFEIFKKSGETTMSFLFVINDPWLSSSAKILFQLIYALSAKTGCCYMTDLDLAHQAGISKSAVKNGMTALKKKEWLTSEMVTTNTGHRRRISVSYHILRRDCPKDEKYKDANIDVRGFAKDKKDKFCNNAIATYVYCKKYRQEVMLIKPISYDKRLPHQIRAMFSLISSLSVIYGFCFARNRFLSEKMGVKRGTVPNHLDALAQANLITKSYSDKGRYIRLKFDELKKRYLKKDNK